MTEEEKKLEEYLKQKQKEQDSKRTSIFEKENVNQRPK